MELLSQKNSYPTRITLDLLIFIILDDLQAAFLPDTIPPIPQKMILHQCTKNSDMFGCDVLAWVQQTSLGAKKTNI